MNHELDAQLDCCLKSLEVFRSVVFRRNWPELDRARGQFELALERLSQLLAEAGELQGAEFEKIKLLDVQIRQSRRMLSQQMNRVSEETSIIDRGVRKLNNIREHLGLGRNQD